ncbi:MAG: MATE family efflux transporter, partial [Peptostreptococcaceae bacterium]
FINTLFAISVLFSTGASTVISITLGRGDTKKANEYFSFNTMLLILLSILMIVISLLNLDNLSILLGATNSTLSYVKGYLGIIILFIPCYLISYSLELIIKCDGYPHLSTIGVVISAITNIVLDYIFVLKLNWGVEGAALATGIARVFSITFFLIHFLRKKGKLSFCKFNFDLGFIKRIISIGLPDCTTEASLGIVVLLFNQCILRFIGEDALVSYSVICYINTLIISTMMGISQGLQPICSFYYGKKDYKSVFNLLNTSLNTVRKCSWISFFIIILLAEVITSIFIDRSSIQLFDYTVLTLRISSISFLLVGSNIIISSFCVSTEKHLFASIISLSRGLVIISLTLITMIVVFGGKSIWFVTLISELIVFIMAKVMLKKRVNELKTIKHIIYNDAIA